MQKSIEKDYHCDLCRCPTDRYAHYKTYQSDNGCSLSSQFYNFTQDILENGKFVEINFLIQKFSKAFSSEYTDVPCFETTIKEFISIDIDCGVLHEYYPGLLCDCLTHVPTPNSSITNQKEVA